jgi:hypothetical protein
MDSPDEKPLDMMMYTIYRSAKTSNKEKIDINSDSQKVFSLR